MAKKRKKRRHTRKKTSRPTASPVQFIITELPVAAGATDSAVRYVAAHQLLPPDYPEMAIDQQQQMAAGLRCLDDPTASGHDRLAAIMLLAHTPDVRALQALQRYAASGAVHADMAELGAEECAMWLGDSGQPLMTAPDVMLN